MLSTVGVVEAVLAVRGRARAVMSVLVRVVVSARVQARGLRVRVVEAQVAAAMRTSRMDNRSMLFLVAPWVQQQAQYQRVRKRVHQDLHLHANEQPKQSHEAHDLQVTRKKMREL